MCMAHRKLSTNVLFPSREQSPWGMSLEKEVVLQTERSGDEENGGAKKAFSVSGTALGAASTTRFPGQKHWSYMTHPCWLLVVL